MAHLLFCFLGLVRGFASADQLRYGWEDSFETRLDSVREKELKQLRKYQILNIISSAMWATAPILTALALGPCLGILVVSNYSRDFCALGCAYTLHPIDPEQSDPGYVCRVFVALQRADTQHRFYSRGPLQRPALSTDHVSERDTKALEH